MPLPYPQMPGGTFLANLTWYLEEIFVGAHPKSAHCAPGHCTRCMHRTVSRRPMALSPPASASAFGSAFTPRKPAFGCALVAVSLALSLLTRAVLLLSGACAWLSAVMLALFRGCRVLGCWASVCACVGVERKAAGELTACWIRPCEQHDSANTSCSIWSSLRSCVCL